MGGFRLLFALLIVNTPLFAIYTTWKILSEART